MNNDNKFYQDLDYLNIWKPALDAKAFYQPSRKQLAEAISNLGRIKVLDCGTGTGRGLVSLLEEGVIVEADIEAFDIKRELVADMPRLFQEYAHQNGWDYYQLGNSKRSNFKFKVRSVIKNIDVTIHGFEQSIYELDLHRKELQDADLIIGQAFIEHVNQGIAYPILTSLLKENGWVYFYMNCDGWFNYSPSQNCELDEKIVSLFNDLALNNQEFKNDFGAIFGGEAFCGRHLPHRFRKYGLTTFSFGPSDWVVTPYQQNSHEIEFLKYTSRFIKEICSSPESEAMRKKWDLTIKDIYEWQIEKLEAIENKEIGFTCVQKDILGRKL